MCGEGGETAGVIPTDFSISLTSSESTSENASISSEGGITGAGRGVGMGGRVVKSDVVCAFCRGDDGTGEGYA